VVEGHIISFGLDSFKRSREALRSREKTALERVEAGERSRAVPNKS
jgi:hypothetical protein